MKFFFVFFLDMKMCKFYVVQRHAGIKNVASEQVLFFAFVCAVVHTLVKMDRAIMDKAAMQEL